MDLFLTFPPEIPERFIDFYGALTHLRIKCHPVCLGKLSDLPVDTSADPLFIPLCAAQLNDQIIFGFFKVHQHIFDFITLLFPDSIHYSAVSCILYNAFKRFPGFESLIVLFHVDCRHCVFIRKFDIYAKPAGVVCLNYFLYADIRSAVFFRQVVLYFRADSRSKFFNRVDIVESHINPPVFPYRYCLP